MRLKSSEAIAYRYKLILDLHKSGKTGVCIAHTVQCTPGNVSLFLKRYAQRGAAALEVGTDNNSRPCRLSESQFKELANLLREGASNHGFVTDNWTQQRVADLIEKRFEVRYSTSHISQIIKRIGFTSQKPERHSYRQDPEQVEEWREQTLPDLKKKR